MTGMNRSTGILQTEEQHIGDRIQDLLTTPIGSRPHRRTYGCDIHKYSAAPINADTIADITAEVATAINTWEPTFGLKQVTVLKITAGHIELELVSKNGSVLVRSV